MDMGMGLTVKLTQFEKVSSNNLNIHIKIRNFAECMKTKQSVNVQVIGGKFLKLS